MPIGSGRFGFGNCLRFRFNGNWLRSGFLNRLGNGFQPGRCGLCNGLGFRNKFRFCDRFRDFRFGGRLRRFRLRHRFFRLGERIEREHLAQVDDPGNSCRLLPYGGLRRAEAHLIIDRPQFFERQVPFEGRDSVRLRPPFDEGRKLPQFALYRF